MRKKLQKLLLVGLLAAGASAVQAKDNRYVYDSNSLVGFEVGYTSFKVEDPTGADETEQSVSGGMKIGAETRNVRLFLSFKNAFVEDFDKSYMYGAELQYLFNIASFANFFIGANYGKVNMEFDDGTNNREFSTSYMGGDAGLNFHVTDSLDIEIAGRYMTLNDSEHTLGTGATATTYTFDDIITGYMSLIYKYQID
jgi:opacity protein-like surface antigen